MASLSCNRFVRRKYGRVFQLQVAAEELNEIQLAILLIFSGRTWKAPAALMAETTSSP